MRGRRKLATCATLLPGLLCTAWGATVSDSAHNASVQLQGGSIRIDVGGTLRFPDQVVTGNPIQITTAAGPLRVAINDARGSGNGWALTLQSSDFLDSGDARIPASGFTYFNPDANPLQSIDWPGSPPTAPHYNQPVPLASPTLVLIASLDEGMGNGSATLERRLFALHIPADARAGFYRATLTATVTYEP